MEIGAKPARGAAAMARPSVRVAKYSVIMADVKRTLNKNIYIRIAYQLIIIKASVQLIAPESFEPMFPLFTKHGLAYEHFVVLRCALGSTRTPCTQQGPCFVIVVCF